MNCDIEAMHSADCMPYRIGTQKQVDLYTGKFIRKKVYYRPVYDTVELKKLYPNLKRSSYYDSTFFNQPVIPLTETDSLLIRKALSMNINCKNNYLNFIIGFSLFETREIPKNSRSKKETDFKAPKKTGKSKII